MCWIYKSVRAPLRCYEVPLRRCKAREESNFIHACFYFGPLQILTLEIFLGWLDFRTVSPHHSPPDELLTLSSTQVAVDASQHHLPGSPDGQFLGDTLPKWELLRIRYRFLPSSVKMCICKRSNCFIAFAILTVLHQLLWNHHKHWTSSFQTTSLHTAKHRMPSNKPCSICIFSPDLCLI